MHQCYEIRHFVPNPSLKTPFPAKFRGFSITHNQGVEVSCPTGPTLKISHLRLFNGVAFSFLRVGVMGWCWINLKSYSGFSRSR